jgi:hypothetical protein
MIHGFFVPYIGAKILREIMNAGGVEGGGSAGRGVSWAGLGGQV